MGFISLIPDSQRIKRLVKNGGAICDWLMIEWVVEEIGAGRMTGEEPVIVIKRRHYWCSIGYRYRKAIIPNFKNIAIFQARFNTPANGLRRAVEKSTIGTSIDKV